MSTQETKIEEMTDDLLLANFAHAFGAIGRQTEADKQFLQFRAELLSRLERGREGQELGELEAIISQLRSQLDNCHAAHLRLGSAPSTSSATSEVIYTGLTIDRESVPGWAARLAEDLFYCTRGDIYKYLPDTSAKKSFAETIARSLHTILNQATISPRNCRHCGKSQEEHDRAGGWCLDNSKRFYAAPPHPSDGWIAVGERLPEAIYGDGVKEPEISDDVLVHFPGGDGSVYEIANYDHETTNWTLVTHGFQTAEIDPTHWRPLPAPPATPETQQAKEK